MSDPELEALRRHIDGLDQELLALLAQRCRLAVDIGQHKARQGRPIRDPQREAELLDAREEQGASLELDPDFVRELFALIVSRSRAVQEP